MKINTSIKSYRALSGISIVMVVLSFAIGCSESGRGDEYIKRMKNINSFNIARISIYEKLVQQKHENRKILETHEQSIIHNLVSSLRSLKKVDPNHPQFPNMWLIKIEYKGKSKDVEEFLVLQRRGYPERLYIEFPPNGFFGITEYAVSFDLYNWMEEQRILQK